MEEAPLERRGDRLTWAVFAAFAALYRLGRCPSYGPADSPGVVLDALTGRGHDLLSRLGAAVSRLPGDTPEGWVNALSGPFSAGAAALLFALLRRLGLGRAPALAAALLAATVHQSWYYALVAGRAPLAVFGLALAVWSVVAWKDEARSWPLALGAAGAALAAFYAPRALTLVPAAQWLSALLAGLLIQRLDGARPGAAVGALAGVLVLAAARPYDLRSHNPTREWALAALESARGAVCVVTLDPALTDALTLEARRTGSPVLARGEACAAALYDPLVPRDCVPRARGVLLDACGAPALPPAEAARAVLAMPALTSVGRRDRAKYSFAREDGLYERYAAVLRAHRDALPPAETDLRRALDAQLADYAPR